MIRRWVSSRWGILDVSVGRNALVQQVDSAEVHLRG